MELILKTNSPGKVAKVLALAEELHISVESRGTLLKSRAEKETLKRAIMDFYAKSDSSFGDPANWGRAEREDRNLPFSGK